MLKLFLSPSTIEMIMGEAIFQANRLSRPKHGRDRSFLRSLIAVKLALLGNKLLLLALAEVLGPKLSLNKRVIGLHNHVTCPLSDILMLLNHNSVEDLSSRADDRTG